jgi:uncharacterized protein
LILYLDTSVVVAALTPEAGSARVQEWIAGQAPGVLAVSEWGRVEFSSALAIKARSKAIDLEQRAAALSAYARFSEESFVILATGDRHMQAAAFIVDQFALGLRGGDALHLAVCAEHGATLCTLDRKLFEAGAILGVPTRML